MAKLTNVRERVHQPFYDTLIRSAGLGGVPQSLSDRAQLFTNQAKQDEITALTNLENGSTLPSDQSHVTLALRCFVWYRNAVIRGAENADGYLANNGDVAPGAITAGGLWATGGSGQGQSVGTAPDVYRLYWQTMEQLHWSFGTGEKFSIINMPTKFFPDGGGLAGIGHGNTTIFQANNGTPDHTAILRLARAILLPPRQNVKCVATISRLPTGSGQTGTIGTSQGQRDMYSLTANLNAIDGIQKVIQFSFDGLFARDVQ